MACEMAVCAGERAYRGVGFGVAAGCLVMSRVEGMEVGGGIAAWGGRTKVHGAGCGPGADGLAFGTPAARRCGIH